jgi:flavin reductase (DIM6/NTAB) family NADH-FMN oxidoreductase RutF
VSDAASQNPLRNTVGKALGRIPSGVFVLAARENDRALGMLASWIQQAAFDPPAISLVLAKDRPMLDTIKRSRKFAISILGDGDKEVMRHFAKPRAPDEDSFEGIKIATAPSGPPIVARALAWLDCELIDALDFASDHELLIARVVAGDILRPGHSFTHVRGNGFHY